MLPRPPNSDGRRDAVLERGGLTALEEFCGPTMIVWDRCIRLGGARGPPGTEGATGGTLAGRGVGSVLGGLLVSKFLVGDAGVLGPCSLFRLVLRPKPKKKTPLDFEGDNSERVEEAEDVATIVDTLERPLRGVIARAG